MKNKDKFTRNLIWGLISFQTVLTAIFFIIQDLRIYFGRTEGSQTYTSELVGKMLLEILPVIIIWILFVCVGGVMSYIKKIDDKNIAKSTNQMKLNSILCIIPNDRIEENDNDYLELKKEEKKRKICWLIFFCILAVCLLFTSLFLFNPKNYELGGVQVTQALNVLIHVLPFIVIFFIALIGAIFYENYSYSKSLVLAKKLLAKYKKGDVSYKEESKRYKIMYHTAQGIIVAIAVIFIIVGAVYGGAGGVLEKAAKICQECIGLG